MAFLLEQNPEYRHLAEGLRPPLEKALEFWAYIASPLGTMPAVNDGRRGILPAEDLITGGRWFGREDVLWIAERLSGLPADGPKKEPSRCSVNFPASKFAVMRSDWARDARYMIVNYGPWGGGHSHADILSFELFAFGRALAVDAGIGVSYDDPLHRSWYTTSRAHNMVVVDDEDLNRRMADGEEVIWSSQRGLDVLAATHQGYLETKGITHRRHIAFAKPEYWVLFDVIRSREDGHRLSWVLHVPTELRMREDGYVSTDEPGLLVLYADGEALMDRREGKGRAALNGLGTEWADIGWIALDEESRADEPITFGVLLYPFRESPPSIHFAKGSDLPEDKHIGHFTVGCGDRVDHLVFSDGKWRNFGDGLIATDALFLMLRCRGDIPEYFSLVGGSRLGFQGKTLFEGKKREDVERNL